MVFMLVFIFVFMVCKNHIIPYRQFSNPGTHHLEGSMFEYHMCLKLRYEKTGYMIEDDRERLTLYFKSKFAIRIASNLAMGVRLLQPSSLSQHADAPSTGISPMVSLRRSLEMRLWPFRSCARRISAADLDSNVRC